MKQTHHTSALFSEKHWTRWKPPYSGKVVYQIVVQWNTEFLTDTRQFIYGRYFLNIKGISPLPHRQSSPYHEIIHFWSVGKVLIIFLGKWTSPKGIRKWDNFVGEFRSRTIHFVNVLQVKTCQSFINVINGSLDWEVQNLLLLDKIIIFPDLLCD